MSYNTYQIILKIIPLVMAGAYCCGYTKIKENRVSFPLYLYFAMIPFVSKANLPYIDILLKAVLLMGFAVLLWKKGKLLRINYYELIFFSFIIITFLINYESIDLGKAGVAVINLGRILMFTLYAYNDIDTHDKLAQILKLFFINSIVLGICVMIEYFLVGITRPEVSMNNPNYLAFYFCIAMMCGIYISNIPILARGSFLLLCVVAIYLTGSHSVFLSIGLILLYGLTFCVNLRSLRRIYITGIIVVSLLYIFVVILSGNTNYGLLKYFVRAGDHVRVYIWQNAWETFKTHILFGIGWGGYGFVNDSMFGDIEWVTHNDILRVMVEVGLCGLTVMTLYLNEIISRLISYTNREAFFLGSIFLIVFSLSLAHNNMNSILFWWALSLPLYKNCFT